LEAKEAELQKTISGLFTNDVFTSPSNMIIDPPNENEMPHYNSQAETSSRRLIFDIKDLI
jgi:hypothetical protein